MFEAVEQGSSALSLTLGKQFSVFTWIKMPLEMGWDEVFYKILQTYFCSVLVNQTMLGLTFL